MTYLPKNKVSERTCERCKSTFMARAASQKYCDGCKPVVASERSKAAGASYRKRQKQVGE